VKRAATATPERPRTQNALDANVDLAPRASSAEPIPSQEMATSSRLHIKRAPATKSSTSNKPIMSSSNKPMTKGSGDGKKTSSTTEQHICPICSKTIQTDNAGLNAHIDWCLSRSAILEASAAASSSSGSKKMKNNSTNKVGGSKKLGESSKGKGSKPDIRLAWKQLN
jgi:DNA polymerase kappa